MDNKQSKSDSENELPKFDPDLSPRSEQNRNAAKARGLQFSRGCYRDPDGSKVRDRFGQPY